LQLAADSGNIKLCRFLLQESSLFRRDEIINRALRRLFGYAVARLEFDHGKRFVEDVMHFTTEHVMVVNVDMETFKALVELHQSKSMEWESSLVAQIPVHDIPFADRFTIAIESEDWPPDFFAATFRDDELIMLATQANGAGKTALHWVLSRYGNYVRFDVDDLDVAIKYANIAIELMRKGSDIHARWNRSDWGTISKDSPLLSFLQGSRQSYPWTAASLSKATQRWGQMLVEAGMSLPDYAATENVFLRANHDPLHTLDGRDFVVAELEVAVQNRLTMRVEHNFEVPIWKAKPTHVPGEWPASFSFPGPISWLPEVPNTIIWTPEGQDEREGFRWVSAGNVCIKTHSFLIEPAETTENYGPDSIVEAILEYDEFGRANQHHDLSVVIMENDEGFWQKPRTYTRPRSASDPVKENIRQVGKDMNHLPGPWCGAPHKCASDMRWKMSRISGPSLRDCMHGTCRCRGPLEKGVYWYSTWEANLLLDERHVRIAKRFAQRFCPQYLHVVERTSARVAERAQLAMGPTRRPEKSW
jgi:hypothetical protein